jgi:6-phosphogluconolactonase/glucosamine-6-phosphate isomerase/deaminase
VRHPQSDQIRITLTPLALKKSNRITYHVIGREKAEIVSDLISGSAGKDSCPAAQIFGEWYLDQAAASYLP